MLYIICHQGKDEMPLYIHRLPELVLCFTEQITHFYTLNICGNPKLSKSTDIFPTIPVHFTSLCYINSHSFSTFSIIIIFVMVICDQ